VVGNDIAGQVSVVDSCEYSVTFEFHKMQRIF
jgi:hypothetical protein